MKRIMLAIGMLSLSGGLLMAKGEADTSHTEWAKTDAAGKWKEDFVSTVFLSTIKGCLSEFEASEITKQIVKATAPFTWTIYCGDQLVKAPTWEEQKKKSSANAVGDKTVLHEKNVLDAKAFRKIEFNDLGLILLQLEVPQMDKSVGVVYVPTVGQEFKGKTVRLIAAREMTKGKDMIMFYSLIGQRVNAKSTWTEIGSVEVVSPEQLEGVKVALKDYAYILATGEIVVDFKDPRFKPLLLAINPETVTKDVKTGKMVNFK